MFKHLRAVGATAVAAFAAAALTSCISDGPNKTGGVFLAQHGILLQDTLFHFTLKHLPVDTFWTSEAATTRLGDPDIRHLGDAYLLAGRTGDFSAESRMSFEISDTSMFDTTLAADIAADSIQDSTAFWLSLYFARPSNSTLGLKELAATLDSNRTRDTLKFEVQSWDSTSNNMSGEAWVQKLGMWNRQYLYRQDTAAVGVLPEPFARDTISIGTRKAFGADSTQKQKLPNLSRRMLQKPGFKHFVHLRIVPIAGPNSDSGAAMLRFGGWQGDDVNVRKNPLLLFGNQATAYANTVKNRLQPMAVGSVRAVNYSLRYDGPRTDILTGKQRGLHVVLDRAVVLDSIDAALLRLGKAKQTRSTDGEFDLSYFVPFAKITLPLDKPTLEGGFPLEMQLTTAQDSLLGDTLKGGIRIDEIPDGSTKTIWKTYEPGHPESVLDNVSLSYRAIDADLRMVLLRYSKDSSNNDTIYIHRESTKEWIASLQGYGKSYLSMTLEAGSSSLTVRSYLTVRPETEKNSFIDPETGKANTDLLELKKHFVKTGDTSLTLRATHGFQHLMNRTATGVSLLQDFTFIPVGSPALDDSVAIGSKNVPDKVPYPVLSVIPPKLDAGKLQVDVELYLFPLKAR
ncbi:MAG: hypothetical protein ABIW76_02515 [Fibrobacteria bacterium]